MRLTYHTEVVAALALDHLGNGLSDHVHNAAGSGIILEGKRRCLER